MNDSEEVPTGYTYWSGDPEHTSTYLWPALFRLIEATTRGLARPVSVIDVGSGNGAFAAALAARGFDVVAIDPSPTGAEQARRAHRGLRVLQGSAYEDLAAAHGTFPVVTCVEVIEHCFFPRRILSTLFALLQPGGTLLLSTPYHGYWKNLALAVTGKLDAHFTALWDYGHIKFFSARTIASLCKEAGFVGNTIERVGRVPPLAKSMIVLAHRPVTSSRIPGAMDKACYDSKT